MFNNPGRKIQSFAVVVTVISMIASVIGGIAIGTYIGYFVGFLTGVVTIVCGILISWLSGLIIYGFGTLIENSEVIANNTTTLNK